MLNNNAGRMHVPEDKDQALVQTPYGKGMVIRTRRDDSNAISMREIELTDWVKPKRSTGRPQRPSKLYSPAKFPSVKPEVGSEVITIFGRGKVVETRNDQMVAVKISSWRLAGRSIVTCYIRQDAVQVVRPHKHYEMNAYEKVEHGQHLKQEASAKFAVKKYEEALELYAKAVDAVRYVQHTKDSSNELRSDLLVVMITCCNNAATCCIQLQQWDRAYKFGKNALILLDALYKKKGNSKIHKLLNREGYRDSQLFGSWKTKSYLVCARSLVERHRNEEAIDTCKTALEVVSEYKIAGDTMYQQLQGQEKQIRRLLVASKERKKVEKKKEKRRARAMFGGVEEKKDSEKKELTVETTESYPAAKERPPVQPNLVLQTESIDKLVKLEAKDRAKRVSFADGSTPGSIEDDNEPSFFEEHQEALFVLAGLGLGAALVTSLFRRR